MLLILFGCAVPVLVGIALALMYRRPRPAPVEIAGPPLAEQIARRGSPRRRRRFDRAARRSHLAAVLPGDARR